MGKCNVGLRVLLELVQNAVPIHGGTENLSTKTNSSSPTIQWVVHYMSSLLCAGHREQCHSSPIGCRNRPFHPSYANIVHPCLQVAYPIVVAQTSRNDFLAFQQHLACFADGHTAVQAQCLLCMCSFTLDILGATDELMLFQLQNFHI